MKHATQAGFAYIQDSNPFFELWPHRYDYLWAPHPTPAEQAQWQTESKHPLSDRLLEQGAYLYGIRFGKETHYAMLDIDRASAYHPAQDPLAITRIKAVLEEHLGLAGGVLCSSSYSGGLHLYLPFNRSFKTFDVASAIAGVLELAGFKIAGGLLEVFPNRKPFAADDSISLYQGHRLPLQQGSYLLDDTLAPMMSTHARFIEQWQWAAAKNTLDPALLQQALKRLRKPYCITKKAAKFLNDLNAEIEQGWTGAGQTNRLLGRIAMRAYVFGQMLLELARPLAGTKLVEVILNTARSLPGFNEFCHHQHELEERVKAWARAVENSHYYPYGSGKKPKANTTADSCIASWNQRQQTAARARISEAVATLQEQGNWPEQATHRFKLLTESGISGATLYRHQELWHPKAAPAKTESGTSQRQGGESEGFPPKPTSLLGDSGCNTSVDKGSTPQTIRQHMQQAVINAQQQWRRYQQEQQQQKDLAQQYTYFQRMMEYLQSGDMILQREAEQWLYGEGYS